MFHDHPVEAKHAQWKDIEATLETCEGKAEYFALFYAVFRQLLGQNPRRHIGPIPPKCLAFLEEEMHDPVLSAVADSLPRSWSER